MAKSNAIHSDKPTVLLVDDNEQNLELLEIYMEDLSDVRVVTATNGLEAMERVEKDKPDLILLDIMMPKMSGFEVCKRVKSDPKTRDTIIVMVTAPTKPATSSGRPSAAPTTTFPSRSRRRPWSIWCAACWPPRPRDSREGRNARPYREPPALYVA